MSTQIVKLHPELRGPLLIRQIMSERGFLQKEIAQTIGVSEAQLSLILREERSITREVALQFATKFGGAVDSYIWDVGRKTLSKGLVTGDVLRNLCETSDVLSGHERENIQRSFVTLRIDGLVDVVRGDTPDQVGATDINDHPLALRCGNVVRVSILERLALPSDIRGDIHLSRERVFDGFAPAGFAMQPDSPSFPPVTLQYWGGSTALLSAKDRLFTLSLFRV